MVRFRAPASPRIEPAIRTAKDAADDGHSFARVLRGRVGHVEKAGEAAHVR